MMVTVEGIITDVYEKEKDGKVNTEILMVQKGCKEQVVVRLEGRQANLYTEFEKNTFTGRLIAWSSRNGNVGTMVMA